MTKYTKHTVGDDGFTEWFNPMPLWKVSCCDCGLVHDIELKIKNKRILIRAKRNYRATGQKRRHMNRRKDD
jgi:hypothetical protein